MTSSAQHPRGFIGDALLLVAAAGIGLLLLIGILGLSTGRILPSIGELWREWTAFEGFRTHSINVVVGGRGQPSLVLGVALWIGLTLMLWHGIQWWRRRRPTLLPALLIVLSGWLVLDARWLWDLHRQQQLGHARYAGKTAVEKRRSEPGAAGANYRFAEAVLAALPEQPQRILITSQQRYWRYRLNYFLLPHNSAVVPADPDMIRSGDILIIHDQPRINGYPTPPNRIRLVLDDGRPLGIGHILVQGPDGYAFRME